MAVRQPGPETDLASAFGAFNSVSEQLTAAYGALEQQVVRLTAELAQARRDRARSHDESVQLANRLSHLLAAMPSGVVVLDGQGRIEQCNPAAIELLGEPLQGIAWTEVIARRFAPRPDDGHEISLKDGRRVSVATRALDPASGQLIVLTDLTATRVLQQQVARHERLVAMGEMVASLAHQVRTPLASAMLNLSNLAHPALAVEDRARLAERIRERLHHLDHLVNDMLLFARGGQSVAAPFGLSALLTQVAQTMEPQTAAAGCEFRWTNHCGDVELLGNAEALTGAVTNLLCNAVEACGAGGTIALECHVDNTDVTIVVADNGPGITPDVQARLFEPFFTTRAQGNGLGLAVVQAVAQAHGGHAWCRSQPGQGATFGLSLPRPKEAA
jgi:two-component system sensor histidine kinase FlrB